MAEEDELSKMITHLPSRLSSAPELFCCCGSANCLYLQQNCLVLEQLEREVKTAAQLGQALLSRHEHYIQHAEREKMEMSLKNEQLKGDKKELEEKNAKTQQMNRELFDQLEVLNLSIAQSETHIKALEATLDSTRFEFRRLQALAARTEDLETQLSSLEQEQELLRSTIWTTQEQKLTAVYRWKTAERRLAELQEQLETLDNERRDERERHAEVVARLKRRKTYEQESTSEAQRWKETAASETLQKKGGDITSHFVKKILHDNANLQSGITELQEMLANSNDEVQILREQLTLHQPDFGRKAGIYDSTLRTELTRNNKPETSIITQNLRIHNHYYSTAKIDKSRRQRRKRSSLDNVTYSSPRPHKFRHRRNETDHLVLSQTSLTLPGPSTPIKKRWSQQTCSFSDLTHSSVTSSTQSKFWPNVTSQRGFDFHSSNPTSPGSSVDFKSPTYGPKRQDGEISKRNTGTFIHLHDGVIYEDLGENNKTEESHELDPLEIPFYHLRSRPQATSTSFSRSITTGPSLVTARPTIVGRDRDSTFYLRSSMLMKNEIRSVKFRDPSDASVAVYNANSHAVRAKLPGWVRRRWGFRSAKVTDTLPSTAEEPDTSTSKTLHTQSSNATLNSDRPAGINQKGTVPGFFKKATSLPSQTLPVSVDHEALREILEEDLGALKLGD